MSIDVKSLTFIGALLGVGGIALVKIGPVVGPITINKEASILSEDDEQRARAARIIAERKARKAAEDRAEAEEKAVEAARQREHRDRTIVENNLAEIKNEFGEVYATFCKGNFGDRELLNCYQNAVKNKCPVPTLGGWSVRITEHGVMVFC